MKIATIIGPEDVRNVLAHGHAGTAGTQEIPFAESFNESMTAIAIAPRDFQRELRDGSAGPQEHEEMKGAADERPNMGHLFSEALAGIAAGSKKALSTDGAGLNRSRENSSGEEAELQNPLESLAEKASVKEETSEANIEEPEPSLPNGVQQKDTSATGTDTVIARDTPSADGELTRALIAAAVQMLLPEKNVDGPKEGHRLKETTKTQQEHKVSKKEEAACVMATGTVAQDVPTATETAASVTASVTTSLSIPSNALPKTSDDLSSHAIVALKSVRQVAGETRAVQTKDASQGSLEPVKSNGSPRQSVDQSLLEAADATKDEMRTTGGLPKNEGANVTSPPSEKNHPQSPETGFNLVSTVLPVHSQGMPASLPEKSTPVHVVPADVQQGTGPTTSQLYGTDVHRTLTASPTTLEVGVPGGTHGWLKVRAELTGDGVVHASVSSSSDAGTEMLRRELPSLTSYLHQEQLPVSSVVVHASSSGMDVRNFAGDGQGHDPGQGSPDPHGGARQEGGTAYPGEDASHSGSFNEMDGQDSPLSTGYGVGGGWLSIRA